MLPRHLRRAIPAPTPFRLAAFAANAHRPHALAALRYRPVAGSTASFHSSSRRRDELPKSPFQTFVDVLRDELRKNRELQENVKQLQGDVDKFQDSEAMRKARAAYERARVRSRDLPCGGVSSDWINVFPSSPRASKRTRDFGLLLRSSKSAALKSATRSPRRSRRWRRANSHARYVSPPNRNTAVLFLTVYVDIEGDRSRLVYYCHYYRAHS